MLQKSAGMMLLAATISGCGAPQSTLSEGSDILALDQSIVQALTPLLADYRPSAVRMRVVMEQTIRSGAIFGKDSHWRINTAYERQDRGVWAQLARIQGSDAAISSQGLTLCGLAFLATAGMTSSAQANTVALPIGSTFVPFGIRTTVDTQSATRAEKLVADSNEICRAQPGSRFSYQLQSESRRRTSGLLALTSTVPVSYQETCVVASERLPATQLGLPVSGDALQVACDRAVVGGANLKREYVFLPEAGFYFLVSETGNQQVHRYQYQSVVTTP